MCVCDAIAAIAHPRKFALAFWIRSCSFFLRSASALALAARLASIFLANSASFAVMAFILVEAAELLPIAVPKKGFGCMFITIFGLGGTCFLVAALRVVKCLEKEGLVMDDLTLVPPSFFPRDSFTGLVFGGTGVCTLISLADWTDLLTTEVATSARSPNISPPRRRSDGLGVFQIGEIGVLVELDALEGAGLLEPAGISDLLLGGDVGNGDALVAYAELLVPLLGRQRIVLSGRDLAVLDLPFLVGQTAGGIVGDTDVDGTLPAKGDVGNLWSIEADATAACLLVQLLQVGDRG